MATANKGLEVSKGGASQGKKDATREPGFNTGFKILRRVVKGVGMGGSVAQSGAGTRKPASKFSSVTGWSWDLGQLFCQPCSPTQSSHPHLHPISRVG